jgi:nucleoside-diphosphate-sugar epimerase
VRGNSNDRAESIVEPSNMSADFGCAKTNGTSPASRGRRVLVTGASGFTGGHLCRRLSIEGHMVRALVRNEAAAAALSGSVAEVTIGDVRDRAAVGRAVTNVEIVYHVAASYRQGSVSRQEMYATNVQGTRNLLDAAVSAGAKRFIHCSTVGVHGGVKNPPADEQSPFAPGDDYQESKAEAERVVMDYMAAGKMPAVVFRPAGIYGPGDLRFLKLFRAIQTGRFVMVGSGEVLYHLIYIDDLIEGIVLCASQARAVGNVYILAGAEAVKLNQLTEMIAESLDVLPSNLRFPFAPVYVAAVICEAICKPFGVSPPIYRRRVDFFRKTRSFNISKAQKELGFSPKTDLRTGIRLTAEWYKRSGLLIKSVGGPLLPVGPL